MNNHPIVVNIKEDGDALVISHPNHNIDAAQLGTVTGAGPGAHVYPQVRVKRWAFKVLRRVFGRAGRVADWTRTWPGPWVLVDPENGLVFPDTVRDTHGQAVALEVRCLELGDGSVRRGLSFWVILLGEGV